MVSSSSRALGRLSPSADLIRPPALFSSEQPTPIFVKRTFISRLEAVGQSFRRKGLSEAAIALLMAGIRPSTEAAYQSTWDTWSHWCSGRDTDSLSPHLGAILEFLCRLHHSGKAYSTVNIARSMLSVTLEPNEGHSVGSHPLVIKMMKGCYNLNPPCPRYFSTWDPEVVFSFFSLFREGLGPPSGRFVG